MLSGQSVTQSALQKKINIHPFTGAMTIQVVSVTSLLGALHSVEAVTIHSHKWHRIRNE